MAVLSLMLYSCGGGFGGGEVSSKEEYFELKESVAQLKKDFKNKEVSASSYASKMEDYGDAYAQSIENIPPERRYTGAIMCYKEALKHNKKDKDLKSKLQTQQKRFQVVHQ